MMLAPWRSTASTPGSSPAAARGPSSPGGGRGTRLQEQTATIPNPLVEIGSEPILWHVMQIYASQGARRFVLCTGYLGEAIQTFVAERPWPAGVDVECLDTGLDTPTGGRIKRAAGMLGDGPFLLTYADGV